MIRLFCLLVLVTSCLVNLSCSTNCSNLDCITDEGRLRIRLVNSAGTDLVFGPGHRYEKDSIVVYANNPGGLINYPVHPVPAFPATGDSSISLYLVPIRDTVFINLGNGDLDTLFLNYSSRDTKCCGTIRTGTTFRYNDGSLKAFGDLVHTIVKP